MSRPWWLERPTNFWDGFRKGFIQATVLFTAPALAFAIWKLAS